MASAVLANRGEGNWPMETKGGGPKFMGKVPNPNPKKRNFHQEINNGFQIDDVLPAVAQSAASDDASSINRRPSNDHLLVGNYVSFNVATYSKKELFELKNRLVSELEQIRQLKNRIESQQFRSGPKKSSISGNKRPFLSNQFKKLNPQDNGKMMKGCGQILTKLMKNKLGYIFNSPVDVVGLSLHDYYDVIKSPMDLGTVKTKLSKNLYDSPASFAADVRLTFNNAMTYNPKDHEVHIIASQFLARFEELFRPINEKLVHEDVHEPVFVEECPSNSWNFHEGKEKEPLKHQSLQKSELMLSGLAIGSIHNPKLKPPPPAATVPQMPVRTPSPVRVTPAIKPLKQPKPKAKDPNKREMSMEEKHKLGIGLQSLPQEKMEHVILILKKRNGHLRQDEDEIELDIEALDNETLWELDRFVTNYKKMVSKIKRQALMGINNVPSADANRDVPVVEKIEVGTDAKKAKRGEVGEEDVDIGDEIPMSSFPPVEIEKDTAHNNNSSSSSSSSSGSDSSSSSDSDSGSSSGSDSDADDALS